MLVGRSGRTFAPTAIAALAIGFAIAKLVVFSGVEGTRPPTWIVVLFGGALFALGYGFLRSWVAFTARMLEWLYARPFLGVVRRSALFFVGLLAYPLIVAPLLFAAMALR